MTVMGYGKIFESMFTGSMMGAGPVRLALWAYVIANAKPPNGTLEINSRLVALQIGCSRGEIDEALEWLQSPDPESRSQELEGRRLNHDGGFQYWMTNFACYRKIRDEEDRREQNRDAKRRQRVRDRQGGQPGSAQAEAEAEAEA